MAKWKYTKKDGNPKEEGLYWVTLIYNGTTYDQQKGLWCRNGEKHATVTQRFLADITANPAMKDWKMDGQPDSGLVWTVDSGSVDRIYAGQ